MGPAADEIWRGMEDMRAAGLVEKIGFSAYDGDELERCVKRFAPDLVQVPISILDQRLIASGSLARIQDKGIEVHARSVFLQGTILASPESLPERLTGLAQASAAIQSLCRDLELRPIDLALGFVRSLGLVDKVVVGFDTPQQLTEAQTWRPGQLPDLDWSALALSDPDLLNPRNW